MSLLTSDALARGSLGESIALVLDYARRHQRVRDDTDTSFRQGGAIEIDMSTSRAWTALVAEPRQRRVGPGVERGRSAGEDVSQAGSGFEQATLAA